MEGLTHCCCIIAASWLGSEGVIAASWLGSEGVTPIGQVQLYNVS